MIWASGTILGQWDPERGVHRRWDSGHPRPITCLAIAGDRQEVISGSRELEAAQEHRNLREANALRVWNIATAKLVRSLQGHPCGVNDLAVSADGEYVGSAPNPGLYAFQDTAPRVWSLSTGEMLFAFDGHSFTVSAVAFTPDGRLLLSGGGNCFQRYSPESTVKVWDFAGRTLAHNLDRHQGPVVAICVTPDSRWAVSAGGSCGFMNSQYSVDGSVHVWNLDDGKLGASFQGDEAATCMVMADAETFVCGSLNGAVHFLRFET